MFRSKSPIEKALKKSQFWMSQTGLIYSFKIARKISVSTRYGTSKYSWKMIGNCIQLSINKDRITLDLWPNNILIVKGATTCFLCTTPVMSILDYLLTYEDFVYEGLILTFRASKDIITVNDRPYSFKTNGHKISFYTTEKTATFLYDTGINIRLKNGGIMRPAQLDRALKK